MSTQMSIPSERVRLAVALLELEGVGPMTAAEVLAGIAGLPQRADELFKELLKYNYKPLGKYFYMYIVIHGGQD